MASSSRQNNIEKILKDLESDTVFDKNIVNEVEQSFLDYAMSVITSRALPDLKDGLKPVHRRIIYSAYQEKLFNNAKYKKSAALVGTVMGSYHPHGDSSIYDALTRMAQDFSLRYPLIEGQGNFGSIDGDSPAAMRYTEARLSKLGEYFLDGIDEDCIDFMDNYDQSKKEPVVLPTLIPNILVNGTTGIAVGLATNIPPHNLTEVMDAILMLIENENLSEEEIHQIIKGPDFPTGGEIFKYEAVKRYFSERGSKKSLSFRIRSKVEVEEGSKRNLLIVKEIPYGIKKTKITEGIVSLIKPDKNGVVKSQLLAENIVDIRDESNLEGIRLVIECKKDVPPQVILNNLYKFTPLQSSYSPNLTILIDNEPKRVSLPEILRLYVKHQLEMLRRRTQFQLSVINKRLHILDGRIKISSDVLEAIKIINSSETPEEDIKNKYSLSDEQVEDIFKLTIGSLKRISVDKLKTEFDDKTKAKAEKESILGSEQKTKQVLSQQIKDIRDKFGDERRTRINYESSGKIEYVDLFHFEEMVIFLSRKGYVSQVSLDEFKLRRRGGVGVKGAVTHKDDAPKMMLTCFGKDDILFFTDTGRVFRLKAYEMNLRSDKNNRGRITTNLLPGLRKNEEKVVNIFNLSEKDYSDDLFLLFVTKKGMVKKTNISQFRSIRSNGKFAFKLRDGDELKFVIRVKDDSDICLASSGGRLVRFKASDCRPLSRTASGVKAMRLLEKQELISASSTYDGDYVFSIAENGKGKLTHISQFRLTKRGSKIGVIAHKIGSKTGKLLGCTLVKKDDEFLLMTSMSKINRFKISDVRSQSRITSGVNLFKLEEKEKLIYFSKYYPDAEELEDDFKEE